MFDGISRQSTRLIVELAHRQDKLWYQAHKARIDAEVFAPLKALLAEAAEELKPLYPRRELTPKVFRLHRDVRFSKDKSPYKDHAAGVLMIGARREPLASVGALYLQVGPDEGGAAGMWSMEPEQLARYRKAVLHEKHGSVLTLALEPLLARGYSLISAARLSRFPRGVEPSHPRAALLQHKGLALDFPPIPAKVRHSPALCAWCIERAEEVAPVIRWLLAHCA